MTFISRLLELVFRYVDRLRIVIPSASLCKTEWERAVQFGWYCDLPVQRESRAGTLTARGTLTDTGTLGLHEI